MGHRLHRHPEDLGGGDGVDVLPAPEGGLHGLIPGDAGQQPQLDLGVVGVHQLTARRGHEHLPQLRPQLGADRDVLEVGLSGAQAPGGGDRVLEAGVDAPVGGDDLGEALHIGGLELGELPVVQNGLDDGVLPLELFQHLGAGGVARLGLFHRGQAQLVKEDVPQLLGGVDVEGLPRQLIDLGLVSGDALGEHLPKGGQGLPVYQEALPLHLGQDRAQGELHLVIELVHPQLLQPGGQGLAQGPDEGAVLRQGLQGRAVVGQGAESIRGQIGLLGLGELLVEVGQAQLLQVIAAVGGGQQIGGQGGVEDEALPPDALVQQPGEQGLEVVGAFGDVPGKERPEDLLTALPSAGAEDGGPDLLPLPPGDADRLQAGQGQQVHLFLLPPEGEQLRGPVGAGDILPDAGAHRSLLHRGVPLGGLEAQLVDELGKFQLQQELVEGGAVGLPPFGVLRGEVHRGVGADGGQVVGEAGHVLPLRQLFQDGGLGLQAIQPGIDGFDALIALDEVHGGLFPDALDPGDVVAGVPHQGLEVDDVDGLKAVLLPEGLRGHVLFGGLAHAGGHQLHPGGLRDELEGVPVPGDDDGLPPGGGVPHRDGAQKVVGLPAVQLVAGDVHGVQHVLQNGHLDGQLVRHPLALGLVALIGQMPEGGGLPVKADAQGVGGLLVQQLLQDGEEAVDGVGGGAVPGGEHPDPEKGPVDDGIAVDGHELHGSASRL